MNLKKCLHTRLIFWCLAFACSTAAPAQLNLLQQNTSGETFLREVARGITSLPSGGYVSVIHLSNAGATPLGGVFGVVEAYNADGSPTWQTDIGGPGGDVPFDIIVDNNNNILVAGHSSSSTTNGTNNEGWVVKLDASGNVLWQKYFGGSSTDDFRQINQTSDGGYLLVGTTRSNDGDIPAGLPSGTNSGAVWAAKIDVNGNLQWSEIFFGLGVFVTGMEGIETEDGGYLIGSSAFGQGGNVPAGSSDFNYWLVKLDAQRNIQWSKVYGGNGPDHLKSLSPMPGGGYLLSGNSNSQPSGDVSMHFSQDDYWIVRVDNGGNIVWEKSLGGNNADNEARAVINPNGDIFVAGTSWSNDGLVSANYGNQDFWVVKLDANGTLLSEQNFGGSGSDFCHAIALSPNGIFASGSTNSQDVDVEGHNGDNGQDAWVIEVGSGGTGGGDIDLSLSLQQPNANPDQWSSYPVELTIDNDGPSAATGVKVKFPKPNGVVYTGGNEFTASQGVFSAFGNEEWAVGNIPAGGSATLTVNYFLLNATAPTAYAQVTAANQQDIDSTPNNGTPPSVNEDDEASTSGGGGPQCNISASIQDIQCNDAGTPNDPSDDTFGFVTIATNTAPSSGYEFHIVEINQTANGTYGATTATGNIPISAGDLTVILTDNETPTCTATLTVAAPAPCSGGSNLPDLVPQNLAATNTSVQVGAGFGITLTVANLGGAIDPAQLPFATRLYLSTDNTLSANDILINTLTLSAPDNATMGGNVPIGTAPGQYFAIVKTDDDEQVTESNEANNIAVLGQMITVTGGNGGGDIDLSLTLTQANTTPDQWSSYTVQATVLNDGPSTATGVKVSFKKPVGVVYTGGNEWTASQGSFMAFGNEEWTVGSIPAGGSATLTVNYFLLNTTAPTAYAQVIAANETDGDSTPNNGTPPTPNEDDEASTGGGGTSNPDLTVSDLQIPNASVETGQTLNYNFDASNIGNAAASGNFTIKSYISLDNVLSASDIQEGTIITGNYGVGFSVQDVVGASTIPSNLADGQYFLIVKIDADNAVAESNESNNTVVKPFTVTDGGGPGNSCSFTTYYTPTGFDPLNIILGRYLQLEETMDGYTIAQDFGPFAATVQNPTPFDTYELDLEGNVVSAFETSPVPTVNVKVQHVSGNNVEMVFDLSPDLPTGTVVPITIDYPTPPAGLFTSDNALRTSWGYAFTIGIVDTSNPNLTIVVNRVYMTDHVGQNVTFAELPDSDFYSGSSRIFEGPDGSLFTEWLTSGNFSLFVIPGDGSTPWQQRVASDTPSSSWKDTDLSHDGNFVYTMKWDNAQTFVAKYDVSDGTLLGIDLTDLKTPEDPNGFRYTWARGIEPTADGGLLVSLRADEVTTPILHDYEVLAKYNAAGNLVWKLELPNPGFELTPIGETSDGGALFAGRTVAGTSPAQTVFLKTTADGKLTPECDNGNVCNLSASVTQPVCDDNGTPTDPGDDTFSFSFNVTGSSGVSSVWVANIPDANAAGTTTTTNGSYNVPFELTYSIADVNQHLGGTVGFAVLEPGNLTCTTPVVVQAPATCSGGGGTPDCNAITITAASGQLTIVGATAPHVLIKVFRPNWTVAFDCLDNCADPLVVSGLSAGNHHIQIKLLDDNWDEICKRDETVSVPGNDPAPLTTLNSRQRMVFNKIYPNPSKYWVTLEIYSRENQATVLDFYNQQGQAVHRMEVDLKTGRNDVELDVSQWRSGAYNVIGRGNGHPAYGKIVKVWE